MYLEPGRALVDWFQNATYGVNALAAAVPRDAGDSAPPTVAYFNDESRDPRVAEGYPPALLPAVVVQLIGQAQWAGEVQTVIRDGKVSLLIRYLANARTDGAGTANMALGITDASYTMRGIVKSIRQWLDNANYAARTRNGIAVLAADKIMPWNVSRNETDNIIVGNLVLTCDVRDTAP
jgi:hypothetical protein